jgi:hypothetical protein
MRSYRYALAGLGMCLMLVPCAAQTQNPANRDDPKSLTKPAVPRPTLPTQMPAARDRGISHDAMVEEQERRDREEQAERDRDDQGQ